MRSAFDDLALLHDKDLIGTLDRREAVRDGYHRPALDEFFARRLNVSFHLGIQRAGGFIEQKIRGLAQQSACYGYTLLLASKQKKNID